MKTKHTFLFTMLVGFIWSTFLFAHSGGPAATGLGGVNGIFPGVTCNQSGCHNSFPLNSGGGSVSVNGLPTQWTPGTTYPLTVIIQKSGAATYGFQLSAVFDGTNPPQQAGTLTKGATSGTDATRISIVPSGGVLFAEQNSINRGLAPTSTFFVNWTAPATGGTVRFNVAGNAADGDHTPLGDYIYTNVYLIPAGQASTPDFSVDTASTANVTAGSTTTVSVTATALNGFTGNVDLSASGLPAGVTPSFAPSTVAAGMSSTLTLTAATNATVGTGPFMITGTSGSLSHTANVALTVAPLPGTPTHAFTLANFGSSSASTDGSGNLSAGYSVIQPATGNTTPSGVEIFGFRVNGVLLSETGVPASPLIRSGRIYAEVNGPLNTGLAIANPNGQTANLSFFFTDATGTSTPVKATTIAANNQTAKFINEAPFSSALPSASFQGTLSFTSDQPVSVIALRGLTNERSEFLMSTLPVIDTTAPALTGTQAIPDFAAGGGWTTQVFLINPGSTTLAGNVQFIGQNGSAVNVTVNGQSVSAVPYSVAAQSSQKIVASGPAATILGGSVRVVPSGGTTAPTPLVLFSYKPGQFTLTEVGAQTNSGTAFRMYVENSGAAFQPGNIQSGIAVANTTTGTATVTFELFNLDGTSAGLTPATIQLAGSGQVAKFLAEIFQGQTLPQSFRGLLRISSQAAISVVGLRGHVNERADFLTTTTPPTLESAPASAAQQLFPHLVNGGGYTTQFILFSGTAGQITAGMMQFFTQAGAPLSLALSN